MRPCVPCLLVGVDCCRRVVQFSIVLRSLSRAWRRPTTRHSVKSRRWAKRRYGPWDLVGLVRATACGVVRRVQVDIEACNDGGPVVEVDMEVGVLDEPPPPSLADAVRVIRSFTRFMVAVMLCCVSGYVCVTPFRTVVGVDAAGGHSHCCCARQCACRGDVAASWACVL